MSPAGMQGGEGRVLVTGASGFVGSHIVRRLCADGRQVRALLRSTSRRDALAGLPVEIVEGDALDPASLRRAMDGCASVFHAVVDPRFWLTDQTPVWRNNVEGVVNAMDAALDARVQRFVFISSMGTLGTNPHGPVTEETPFNWRDRAPPYILARLKAETELLRYARDKGLPGVALCVANTYGPQDWQPTPHGAQLRDVAAGTSKVVLDVAQPTVDIRDVAAAAVAAERTGRVGERYIIANEFVSNRRLFGLATELAGKPAPFFLPYRAAYAAAWVGERLAKLTGKRDTMLRTDGVVMSKLFRELDSSKARSELGWRPRPLAETIRDTLDWWATRGGLQG